LRRVGGVDGIVELLTLIQDDAAPRGGYAIGPQPAAAAGPAHRADGIVAALTPVDVYLVPIGPAGYELFCESAEVEDIDPGGETSGGRFYARFRRMMAEVREQRRARRLAEVPADPEMQQPWVLRLRNTVVGWVAEALAEWRLLWHLRKQTAVQLMHPADLDGDRALAETRRRLGRDAEHHLRRLFLSSLVAALLGLLFFVPGPNFLGYYFLFLAVGHLLAWRGARHGLGNVQWRTRASEPLGELRGILDLDPDERAGHVRDVAGRLGLAYLAPFVERMAVRRR
jgi:hypothetical protein